MWICVMKMVLQLEQKARESNNIMKPNEWNPAATLNKVRDRKDVIVGLDIGTSKVVAIVAEINHEEGLEIIGMGSSPSKGLKKGVVVDIESTVHSIQRALEEAELMADCKIREVWTGIAGSHIKSFNSHGMVAIKDEEVSQPDVDRVIETAKAIPIPSDQEVLHVLKQEFVIDGQEDVREPLGMNGVRLEARVHIVTGARSAIQNIAKCVRRCGLDVVDLILQPLASGNSVLSEDERELGVCLLDIGGGTSDMAVYTNGAIKHTSVIPIAGDHITNDIAMALRTPTKEAEEIKLAHGCAYRNLVDAQEMINVPGIGDRRARKLSRHTLVEVIGPRIEELYGLVQDELRRSGFEELVRSGVVITGGTSSMPGMIELGEELFHMPFRLGQPSYSGTLSEVMRNPRFSTGMGLVFSAKEHAEFQKNNRLQRGAVTGVLERMKNWFKANF